MFSELISPVPNSLIESCTIEGKRNIRQFISIHDELEGMPDFNNCHIALLGVCEARRAIGSEGQSDSPDLIRKAFYKLFPGDWPLKVADLGNLFPGERPEDTYAALSELSFELISKNIVLIILGGSQELTFALYRAFDKLEHTVNLSSIDAIFNLGDHSEPLSPSNYLSHIILNKPYNLFNYSHLAFQTYLLPQEELDLMNKMQFDLLRLGELKANLKLAEPLLRDADILSIDLSAMRRSEMPNALNAGANGLSNEELCALCRYAGLSDKLSVAGLFGWDCRVFEDWDEGGIAQAIWYLIEGIHGRKGDFPFASKKDYLRFAVQINDGEEELIFFKSPLSGRWWMDVPMRSLDIKNPGRTSMVPCSEEDYQRALENEIPERWWRAYNKGL